MTHLDLKRRISIIAFYDKERILIQDRRKISKYGEEYGFFGGEIEKGEDPEQALIREIKEELGIELKDYELFRHYVAFVKELKGEIERNVFIAPMPDLNKVKVMEGQLKIIPLIGDNNLKMASGDLELLNEIKKFIEK